MAVNIEDSWGAHQWSRETGGIGDKGRSSCRGHYYVETRREFEAKEHHQIEWARRSDFGEWWLAWLPVSGKAVGLTGVAG